jgi:hypothetical protein
MSSRPLSAVHNNPNNPQTTCEWPVSIVNKTRLAAFFHWLQASLSAFLILQVVAVTLTTPVVCLIHNP